MALAPVRAMYQRLGEVTCLGISYLAQDQEVVSREGPFCEMVTGARTHNNRIQKRKNLVTKRGASLPHSCKNPSYQVSP